MVWGVSFLFLCSVTLWTRIVGSVGSIPTVFRFVGFAARVAFKWFACAAAGLAIVSLGLHPFISFHFPTLRFVVSEFVAVEATSLLGVLRRVVGLFGLSVWWGWFYFV